MILRGYIDEAMSRQKAKSYSELARLLGLNRAMISFMYSEKSLPSDETMIKLAELAGLPKEEALIDLNIWRAKDKPELQKLWIRLSKMIGCFAAIFFILSVFAPSITYAYNDGIIDIMLHTAFIILLFLQYFITINKILNKQEYEFI